MPPHHHEYAATSDRRRSEAGQASLVLTAPPVVSPREAASNDRARARAEDMYTCEELGRILSARHKDATLLRAVMSGERPQAQDSLARLVLECGFREEWREKKETGALGRLRSSPLFSMEKLLSVARSMGERRSVGGTRGGWGGSEGRSEDGSGSENVGATTLEALARTGLTPPEALRESLRLQPVSPPRYHRVNGGVGGAGGVGGLGGIGGGGGSAGGGPKRGGRIVAKRRRPSGGGCGGEGPGGGGPSASSPGPPVAPCDILQEHLQKERVEFAGLVRRASGPSSAWGGGRGRGVGGGGGSNNNRGGGSGGNGDGDGPVAIGRFSGYKGGKRVRDLQSEVAAVRIQRVVRDRTDRANLRRCVEEKRHIEPTPHIQCGVVCGAWCVRGVLERR